MPVDSWVFHLERYFEACRPPVTDDVERIKFAISLLRGSAVDWWRQYLHNLAHNPGETIVINTWAIFSTSLVAQFIPIDARLMARNKIASMRQTQGVAQFASSMRRTALRIPGITDGIGLQLGTL
jgi:Retrotransposon gag protein